VQAVHADEYKVRRVHMYSAFKATVLNVQLLAQLLYIGEFQFDLVAGLQGTMIYNLARELELKRNAAIHLLDVLLGADEKRAALCRQLMMLIFSLCGNEVKGFLIEDGLIDMSVDQ